MTLRIAVIGGGPSTEHDVSLASSAAVADALSTPATDILRFVIDRDGVWWSQRHPLGPTPIQSLRRAIELLEAVDVVFPVIHGPGGEDGTIAALCGLLRIPVVGSGLRAGAVGMDKWSTKVVASAVGVRTTAGFVISAADIEDLVFEDEVVVKPAASGSSYGVSLARDAEQLHDALRVAAGYGDRILVENVIRAREIDVAVLREADGTRWAPPPLEIHTSGVFDTQAKYDGSATFSIPAEISHDERQSLTHAALAVFDALGCRGVARMDFFLTDDGPVLNEVNTTPGMTVHSQVPRMFAAAGVSYEELLTRLVRSASVPDFARAQ